MSATTKRLALALSIASVSLLGAQYNVPFSPRAAGGGGGITFEQGATDNGTASPMSMSLTGVTNGNLLIVMCGYSAGSTATVTGVADNCGDTAWTELQDGGGNTARQTAVYYNDGTSSGSCTTIDVTFSSITNAMCVVGEFTNVTTADIQAGTSAAGFACNTASNTLDPPGTGTDAVLHVGILSHDSGSETFTPGSAWDGQVGEVESGSRTGNMAYVLTDGSSYDAGGTTGTTGWTCSSTSSYGMVQASFGPAS